MDNDIKAYKRTPQKSKCGAPYRRWGKCFSLLPLSLTIALMAAAVAVAAPKKALEQPPSGSRQAAPSPATSKTPLQLLGETIAPGTKKRLLWTLGHTFEGAPLSAPILAVNGINSGPTLCLTAAIHGDEINGIAIVHRVIERLDPNQLNGAVIGVPIVNLHAYRHSSRYLPDRRDLNRYFPGNPNGSSAARIAHSFFQQIVIHCNALVDLHTGSFHRTNLPQVRADLRNPEVLQLARGFTGIAIVHSEGALGTLRQAATEAGIPSLTLEAGEPHRLQLHEVEQSLKGITALMHTLAMITGVTSTTAPELVFHQTKWIRADHAGILLSEIQPGDSVKAGQQLGVISDPITNQETAIVSPYDGHILGMALNQAMLPGYAAYHIGIQTKEPEPMPITEEFWEHTASTTGPTHLAREK